MRRGLIGFVVACVLGTSWPAAAQTVQIQRASTPVATAMQTGATATGVGTVVNTAGYAQVTLLVTAAVAMSGGTTITFQGSPNASTYTSILCWTQGSIAAPASTTTVVGVFICPVGANNVVRANITTYGAGTLSVVGYPAAFAMTFPTAIAADGAKFTSAASGFAPVGGSFETIQSEIADGYQGMLAMTRYRSAKVALYNGSGLETGVAAIPLQVSLANSAANAAAVKVNVASGGIASGAIASGAIASGAVASGAVASGAYASGSIADGAMVTIGALADAKSTATDTTPISAISVLKQISASVQAPPSQAVTNAGTFAVQPAGSVAFDGAAAGVNPNLAGCYASAAAPSDVSADNDATRLWCLRNGAAAVQPTYAGVLGAVGVGATGTGVPRVVDVASGSTGSAPPAQASYQAGVTSGATGGLLAGITICDSQGWLNMTTATTTTIAPLVSSRTIHICSIVAMAGGTTTMTFKRGTGTDCVTSPIAISPGFELTAQAGFTMGNGAGIVLGAAGAGTVGGASAVSEHVCVTNSAAVNLHVLIRYAVY